MRERKEKTRVTGGLNVHLFSLALQIRVHERNVVVAADHIAQRGQPLFYTLDLHRVRQRIAQMLQFLVCRSRGHEKAVTVTARWLVMSPMIPDKNPNNEFLLCFPT